MDFRFSDEQTTIQELARGIFEQELSKERLKAAETTADHVDGPLWKTLAEANLLGVAVPEAQGGMGLGLPELCTLLVEVGRAVAPVPAFPALVLGGFPLARFGSEAQRERWLRPLAAGDLLLSAALEDAGSADPSAPATRARRDGNDFVLDGVKRLVPAAGGAARVLVPARIDAESDAAAALFLVDPSAPGVSLTPGRVSTRDVVFEMRLDGVRVGADARLGGDAADPAVLPWLRDVALTALCAMQVGVSERALEITSGYVRERVQFGVPIGSFQAVQHRAADCWIDLESMRWTTWRAAWRLARGEDATRDAAVAKFWAADGGSRIANAAQHLHGGMGVDLDYPIHRYFLWSKAIELALGGATPQLARLGRVLATTSPTEIA